MKTPCIGVCKNNGGICSGCLRTMNEITNWRQMSDVQHITTIRQITALISTHVCPSCGQGSHCDIKAGKDHCWCFDIEKRDLSGIAKSSSCLCRKCLSSLPLD
ncbi:cysteine-rich CWC family protein [Vibrio taketomensis]|uniref:cysteine-rich CWC family protein n=1 Tax=Vibrio taketomensis TaxID=2572923 RepID=UPI0013895165|nr:cysteine-rich CWC family protein [Vibrio taketomensis]